MYRLQYVLVGKEQADGQNDTNYLSTDLWPTVEVEIIHETIDRKEGGLARYTEIKYAALSVL